ncbi:MAG: ribonuclease R [Bacteroidales bacterium]|nr:ribonuclease R [Bacteroidales bacterium]
MHNKRNEKNSGKFNKRGKSVSKTPKEETIGRVSMTREGYGFIIREGFDDDIFVSARKMRHALHGDTVKVVMTSKKTNTKRIEGEVIDIIERSKKPIIGILQIAGSQAWVITESKNMPYDIRIPIESIDIKENGLKVAALVDDWPRKSDEPFGHIIDILGAPGDNNTEMHAILAEFGLPYKFEANVETEADKISEIISLDEIKSRRDFRKVPTLTIDPADAKDFDDALSLQKLENGNWEIGVHIADVTHYVRLGSLIEKEALDRATSVYLVDRTVPMLPEKLSNKLCSLRPNEEKLCFSAVFEMNDKGKLINKWFGRTVINSDMRFNYDQAQEIIEGGNGPMKNEILKLHELATILRNERFRSGAISFERPEMKVEVDENGKPLGVYSKITKESNWLIEEFMLLANREVAYFIGGKGKEAKTFVYRIHEEPNIEKIIAFRTFIKHFGYEMKPTKNAREISSEINKLLETAKGRPEEGAIEIMALRSMARARYSTDNVGHYGLAFDYYTHFTSPIRRYPDMMVHRLLAMYLDKAKSQDKKYYEERCKYSSEREQLATEAERASIKYKMVEFMQDKVGMEFEGNVSGVTEWGMFVELAETKIEGLVALRDIKEDYLEYDEDSMSLRGKRSGKRFTLGDKVRVKVDRANLEQKQLDFLLIWDKSEENESTSESQTSKKPSGRGPRKSGNPSKKTNSTPKKTNGSSKKSFKEKDSKKPSRRERKGDSKS